MKISVSQAQIFALLFLILAPVGALAQSFGASGSCHFNVNGPSWTDRHELNKRATFRGLGCTLTLVNQQTGLGNLKQYFVTAWHCLDDIDESSEYAFYFNYQSPGSDSDGMPTDARGNMAAPSHYPNPSIVDGFRYRHVSRVNLIRRVRGAFGDFALAELVEPIPPHFNVYYAGWKTHLRFNIASNAPYVDIHHPRGDIKKASRAHVVAAHQNPINTGCTIVTNVIDAVLGFFGIKSTTEVICNYVDIPFITVAAWTNGATEKGSSGSPLYSRNQRLLGVLSGGGAKCGIPVLDEFGKFKNAYNLDEVRSALNPGNDVWVNLNGLDGRAIDCYRELDGLNGQYYPARDYQDENQIILRSDSTLATAGRLRIWSGADFVFEARDEIVLGPGFSIDPGSHFVARVGQGCDDSFSFRQAGPQLPEIPDFKPFVLEEYLAEVLTSSNNNS